MAYVQCRSFDRKKGWRAGLGAAYFVAPRDGLGAARARPPDHYRGLDGDGRHAPNGAIRCANLSAVSQQLLALCAAGSSLFGRKPVHYGQLRGLSRRVQSPAGAIAQPTGLRGCRYGAQRYAGVFPGIGRNGAARCGLYAVYFNRCPHARAAAGSDRGADTGAAGNSERALPGSKFHGGLDGRNDAGNCRRADRAGVRASNRRLHPHRHRADGIGGCQRHCESFRSRLLLYC